MTEKNKQIGERLAAGFELLGAYHKLLAERDSLREQLETMRYELDAVAGIKAERDALQSQLAEAQLEISEAKSMQQGVSQAHVDELESQLAKAQSESIANENTAKAFRKLAVDRGLEIESLQSQLAALRAQESVANIIRCEFDDECEFCNSPEGGSFTRLIHNAEDCTEAEFYICGKCLHEAVRQFTSAALRRQALEALEWLYIESKVTPTALDALLGAEKSITAIKEALK